MEKGKNQHQTIHLVKTKTTRQGSKTCWSNVSDKDVVGVTCCHVPLGGGGLSFLGMGTGTFSSGTTFFGTLKHQH